MRNVSSPVTSRIYFVRKTSQVEYVFFYEPRGFYPYQQKLYVSFYWVANTHTKSSIESFFTVEEDCFIKIFPTSEDPVNDTFLILGDVVKISPTF